MLTNPNVISGQNPVDDGLQLSSIAYKVDQRSSLSYMMWPRDTKSQNFPVGRISRAKTFRTERVNRFRDKNAPKVRKLFFF